MARLRALDAAQQKRPGLALPLAVVKKFGEDNGGQLAGLIAYYAFFSLFPLLLVLVAILGLVLQGDTTLQDKILDSSLASFPVIGTQIRNNIHSLNAGGLPLALGLIATLLGGLGVTHATQVAQDRLWNVAHDKRNSWLRTRTRGLTLLAVLGAVQVVTTVLDGFVVTGSQSIPATVGALLISLILDLGLFTAVFVLLTSYPATIREVLPGAILATILWEILQHAGSYLVVHELNKLSNTYGAFALVLGTLAWMHLGAQATLYAAQFNVVRSKGLWPRALLD
ncbi:MAG: YihY/virulence factor BrkB family protein [Solirubrobacteraceae bacterium]